MWFGRKRWYHRLWDAVKGMARWLIIVGASLLPVLAMDLVTDKLRARLLWRRVKAHVRDVVEWVRHLPDKLRTLVTYGLGISEWHWRRVRARYRAGEYGEAGT